MQINKKIIFLLILFPALSGLIFLASCSTPEGPIKVVLPSIGSPEKPLNNAVESRFQQSSLQGPTAVETAIELSKKHSQLSEEMVILRQEKEDLFTENSLLKDQLTTYKAQLQQTQTELTEANDLLIEMRIELNNWKVNVTGFQDEMRKADTAQLDALLKIFEILGGEVQTELDQAQDAVSSRIHSNQPKQAQTQKIQTISLGESND
jgi:chromosome segregation ATPase